MSREPYAPSMPRAWFLRRASERRYMLREASSLAVAGWSLHLLWGVRCLGAGPEPFAAWLAGHTHPVGVALSSLSLGLLLLHAATWFVITPKVLPQVVAGRRVPALPMVVGAWAVTVAVTVALAWWIGAPDA